LDLLAPLGLNLAIIPHWNNAEGGTFDTRHCFMGEPRFASLTAQLPGETVILGIDEHTVCLIEPESDLAHVLGAGSVTVRCDGAEWAFPSGTDLPLDQLRTRAQNKSRTRTRAPSLAEPEKDSDPGRARGPTDETTRYLAELVRALDAAASPEVKRGLVEQAHMTLHELAGGDQVTIASRGHQDNDPFIEILIEVRLRLREAKQYALADEIRERLAALNIVVEDEGAGTSWRLRV
jgi:hypothetical protein